MTKTGENLTLPAATSLEAAADMLDILIRLHDREVDRELLAGLRDNQFAAWFGEQLQSPAGKSAAKAFGAALADLKEPISDDVLDVLAAEYADLYLTHGYRVSPSGSVWLTEDHLERQLPMFDVRDWYAYYDITVPDWRVRADDHLVHELQFVSFLCRLGSQVGATDAARFLDAHVLTWLPEFCRQAGQRVLAPLYTSVADLTVVVLDELRADLHGITGLERDVCKVTPPSANRELEEDQITFIPGAAESW